MSFLLFFVKCDLECPECIMSCWWVTHYSTSFRFTRLREFRNKCLYIIYTYFFSDLNFKLLQLYLFIINCYESNISCFHRWLIFACLSFCPCWSTPCPTCMRFLNSMRRSLPVATLILASRLSLWMRLMCRSHRMHPWVFSGIQAVIWK